MPSKKELLRSISETIADYRKDDPLLDVAITPDHVDIWVSQFDEEVQIPILAELDHVLERTYCSKDEVSQFLAKLVTNEKFTGSDPCEFWRSVSFLGIQNEGNSQREMLEIFGAVLEEECGFGIEDCEGENGVFLYLDDGIYTGNRIRNDLIPWVSNDCPQKADVHVVTIASHRGGQHYANLGIEEAKRKTGKDVSVHWWRCLDIEDRKSYINSSDVLRPRNLSEDTATQKYADSLAFSPTFRTADTLGENKFFSSEEGRSTLEQEFLKAGVQIRKMCPLLNQYQRPLGNMVLQTLGFGSLLVSYRNCPNNAPLALWVGDPWYPLFPRKTN